MESISYGPSNPRPWLDPVVGLIDMTSPDIFETTLETDTNHKRKNQREYVDRYPADPPLRWMVKYPRDYIWSRALFTERQNRMYHARREHLWPIRFTHNLFGEANAFGIKVLIPIRRAVRSWVRRIRHIALSRVNERKYAPGNEGYRRAKRNFGVMSGTERATRAFTRMLQ